MLETLNSELRGEKSLAVEGGKMKSRKLISVAVLAFFATVPTALANSKWYVDGVHGSNKNDCKSRRTACKTIGHAVRLSSRGDSIVVASAIYVELVTVPFSLQIIGAGASTTIVDGAGVSGAFLTSNPKAHITLSGFTMRNGGGEGDGGAVYNCGSDVTIIDSVLTGNRVVRGNGNDGFGGAIYSCGGGTLNLINDTFSGNMAVEGGAICNGGTLNIYNSTFSGNVARHHRGGAIFNYGTLTINNSTFSGNRTRRGSGGAIHNGVLFVGKGILSINNSTIAGNIAGDGHGGGIFSLSGATAVLQNTIVANNVGGNCKGTLKSKGYNLSSDDSCSFHNAGDLNDTDPNLGRLRNNGGPTKTLALLPGSPAIDSGNPSGCTNGQGHLLKTDQRGKPRPDKEDSSGCDRGAYERQKD
jgi:predicted outer membrane repeat protein